jgi:hypothetical protein
LTEDTDFGEWVYAHNEREISVILLRYSFNETSEISKTLTDLLVKKGPTLFGRFYVVSLNKIRIKSLSETS